MKRLAVCAVVLGVVAPALGEPTIGVVPPEAPRTYVTYDALTGDISYSANTRDAGGGSKFYVYSDTGSSGFFFGAGTLVGDEIHQLGVEPWGGQPGLWPSTITEVKFGCYLYAAAPTTSWSAAVMLIDNPGGADTAGLLGTLLTFITGIGPLGQGVSIVTVTGLKIAKPSPDLWFLVDYSQAPGTIAGAGPLIPGPPWYGASGVPEHPVGYSHNLFWLSSIFYPLHDPWGDFYYEIRGVPAPATVGLLAVGGLCVLRRRGGE